MSDVAVEITGGGTPAGGKTVITGDPITARPGLRVYLVNGAHGMVVELGQLADGGYGLGVFDDDGVLKVRAGELGDGTFGLAAVNDLSQLCDLAALAFGQRTAQVLTQEGTTTTSYADLATAGPTVTALIGQSRRCKVTITAQLNYSTQTYNSFVGGAMGFEVSGQTSIAANDDNALMSRLWHAIPGAAGTTGVQQKFKASYQVLLTGLNPGIHTFTAKYKSLAISNPDGCSFEDRRIWVEPF